MTRPSFRLQVSAALDGAGRLHAPATWTVVRGRTVSLEAGAQRGATACDGVLLPGLVNAHAHLDLAGSAPLPDQGSFPDWLLAVGGARRAESDAGAAAARQARALATRGVVQVGDIDATLGQGTDGRRAAGLDGLGFLEIVGVAAVSARARLRAALEHLDRRGGAGRFGLSPHAPYSVHGAVLPEIARAARSRGLRLAMHLAESEEETRYLLHGDGPFVGFLETIGRGAPFDTAPGLRPTAYADAAGLLGPGTLVVHGNDLDDEDIGRLARRGASVVYCHGTHRHFDRPRHRLLDLHAAGVTLALGTDSGASNRGVDLFTEMGRLAEDRPDVPPALVLSAATRGGRLALGLDPGPAVFAPSSRADGLLLEAPGQDLTGRSADHVMSWALGARPRVLGTWHRGVWRPDGDAKGGIA